VLQPDKLKDESFLAPSGHGAPTPESWRHTARSCPRRTRRAAAGPSHVHASLLPRHRGAAPVHRAVIAGDRETGVSIMRVVQALDAGGVFATAVRR